MNSVSIIIPTRNEEKYITKCLKSVLKFDGIDNIKYEILIVDGNSEDKTLELAKHALEQNPKTEFHIINNPKFFQAYALNLGIKQAQYDYILRLDAHSIYPPDYLNLLFVTALRTNADNTGGILTTLPYDSTLNAQLVQALTTHKFGVGNSGFRTGMKEGPADTVPFGFFRKEIFTKIGLFDERLIRAQDYEFNQRIRIKGGLIWLNPNIVAEYFNQPSVYKFLKKQLVGEGPYNSYMWYLAPYTFTFRHAIPGVFTAAIITASLLTLVSALILHVFIAVLILYALLALFSSFQQARRYRNLSFIIILPFCFFGFHFFYGLGILTGIFKLLFRISPVQIKKNSNSNESAKRHHS